MTEQLDLRLNTWQVLPPGWRAGWVIWPEQASWYRRAAAACPWRP